MTINQLTYLTAIVRAGINLSNAARGLGVSQPNISKQMALLEDEVGSPLFERSGRRLTALTPVGRQVFHHAVNVTEDLARLHAGLMPQSLERTAVIGATAATARHVLPGMLAAAEVETRALTVEVEKLAGDDICRAVMEGRCDIGLVNGLVKPHPDLVFLPWYRWRYRVIYSRSSRIGQRLSRDGNVLRDMPIAACASLTAHRPAVLRAVEELGLGKHINLITANPDEVKEAVRKNELVGLVAEMTFSEQRDAELDSCESPAPFPTLMAWIAIRRRSQLREGVSTLLTALAPQLNPAVVEAFKRRSAQLPPMKAMAGIRIPRYG